jgi:hypothetical protein
MATTSPSDHFRTVGDTPESSGPRKRAPVWILSYEGARFRGPDFSSLLALVAQGHPFVLVRLGGAS